MFGLKIQGRLGNQLFQYVYAQVLCKKFNTSHFLLNAKDFYADRYFEIEVDSVFQYRLKAVLFWLKNFFRVNKVNENQFHSAIKNRQDEKDNAIYTGFYQSEQYYEDTLSDAELRGMFKIKPQFRIDIKDFVGNDKPNVVVHIRRTDYITFGGDHLGGINLTLPETYYKSALSLLPLNECNLVFLSDDIAFVKENFKYPNAVYAEKNSEIVDFQILMQGDYLVLANSSFSWWGACLNTRAKKIVAPKYWLGIKIKEEHPSDIIKRNWTTISVDNDNES